MSTNQTDHLCCHCHCRPRIILLAQQTERFLPSPNYSSVVVTGHERRKNVLYCIEIFWRADQYSSRLWDLHLRTHVRSIVVAYSIREAVKTKPQSTTPFSCQRFASSLSIDPPPVPHCCIVKDDDTGTDFRSKSGTNRSVHHVRNLLRRNDKRRSSGPMIDNHDHQAK